MKTLLYLDQRIDQEVFDIRVWATCDLRHFLLQSSTEASNVHIDSKRVRMNISSSGIGKTVELKVTSVTRRLDFSVLLADIQDSENLNKAQIWLLMRANPQRIRQFC